MNSRRLNRSNCMIRPASRERIKDTALARISQGLAAMRDFSTANVSLGSKATAEVGPEPEPMSAPLPKAAVNSAD